MFKRTIFRYLLLISFFCLGIFLIFPPSVLFSQGFKNKAEVIQIKVKNNFLSVKLENARIREVLREIAHQTGLIFEGLENAEGRVTQEFENIPLDEGLRKISQSFIMIFKKSGVKGDALRVEKVIIIAKKGMSEAPDSGATEKSKTLVSSSSQGSPSTRPVNTKPRQITPSIPKPEVKKPEVKKPEVAKIKAEEKIKAKVKERVTPKEKVKTKKKERVAKKTTPTSLTKPISRPLSTSADLSKAEKYFKEKRWDRAMKYFKKYLAQNPSDLEMQDRYKTAQQNANKAISLYKQAKRLEREEEFVDAYDYYKKAYNIYPLLYDTWERMRAIKKIIKK